MREAVRPAPCPNRARRTRRRFPQPRPERSRAASSSAAASRRRRNRVRNTNRDARRRSFRGPRISPACQGGTTGTFSVRRTRFRVSYIPAATDCSCVQLRVVCGPSHADAGPWQLSQVTPSFSSNVFARASAGTSSAWQARHFAACSDLPRPRMRPMRSPTGPVSAS